MKKSWIFEWWSLYCTILVTGGLIRKGIVFMVKLPPWKVQLQSWSYFDYAVCPLFGLLFYWGIKKLGEKRDKE